ncbi:T9SS type A sorting domain-containing protein [Ginsengibacter hankyongi]|uniref:T9SS type A sorting domain-containing protein n=1 Tax=Ginsengibacter hankyongi TaxID=2607284 RepID=A0A5J5I9J5_9BACT|nr:T9SS type A sorting domain-containing protein [Ginsengibacter hankyongi]KAA9034509.1 T9SS type A sorting domain-containing protein [Ginsengibacter hankyongi]
MEKKFTYYARIIACFLLTIVLLVSSIATKTYAQISCTNERVLFSQTFGVGTTPTSDPDVVTTGLTYQATGSLGAEGIYRVINNTQQKPEWQNSGDHTPNDVDGKMMVINGQEETYYSHEIDNAQGFTPGTYTASLYIMNIDTLGLCGVDALLPNISFRVEYLSEANIWTPFSGSPYTAAPVAQTAPSAPTWVPLGSSFTLPSTGSFVVKSIRLVLSDGTVGGCGNDFAMDDVKFSQCPEGGELPVSFLGVDARQKGSGVSIEWSTSQEINSNSFDVEKSADGNSNWVLVASVNAAGNSSVVKNYNVFDATPLNGVNFYRVKQVDLDGNFKYSKTVRINLNFSKTAVSVLANPFYNTLTVDFSSAIEQSVSARLVDITGKQVAFEKWAISTGNTRMNFSNVSNLQQGMYILNISNADGELLYNNKVIKQ